MPDPERIGLNVERALYRYVLYLHVVDHSDQDEVWVDLETFHIRSNRRLNLFLNCCLRAVVHPHEELASHFLFYWYRR